MRRIPRQLALGIFRRTHDIIKVFASAIGHFLVRATEAQESEEEEETELHDVW